MGKTFLLSHFAQGRRAVSFGATAQAEAVELHRLLECVRRDLGDAAADLAGGGFQSWEFAEGACWRTVERWTRSTT